MLLPRRIVYMYALLHPHLLRAHHTTPHTFTFTRPVTDGDRYTTISPFRAPPSFILHLCTFSPAPPPFAPFALFLYVSSSCSYTFYTFLLSWWWATAVFVFRAAPAPPHARPPFAPALHLPPARSSRRAAFARAAAPRRDALTSVREWCRGAARRAGWGGVARRPPLRACRRALVPARPAARRPVPARVTRSRAAIWRHRPARAMLHHHLYMPPSPMPCRLRS